MSVKRGGLGTNLDSLIPKSLTVAGNEVAQQNEVPVSQISPNPRQPRTVFNEEAMVELVASIKSIGILQPPVVRKVAENKYELIMGERRFRAAKPCGRGYQPADYPDCPALRPQRRAGSPGSRYWPGAGGHGRLPA